MRNPYILELPLQIILSEGFPIFDDFYKIVELIEIEILSKFETDTIRSIEFWYYGVHGLQTFRIENDLVFYGNNKDKKGDLKLFLKAEDGTWI